MSILSSTGTGLYNMPLNEKTLQLFGYKVSYAEPEYLDFYVKREFATHDEFICNLQKSPDEDGRWFTIFRQKMSTSLGPGSDNGIYRFKVYFETTGQLKEFEQYFRIKDDPFYTNEQKEKMLYYLFEQGHKFTIV